MHVAGPGKRCERHPPTPAEAPTVGAQRRRESGVLPAHEVYWPQAVGPSGCVSAARSRFRNLRQPFSFVRVLRGIGTQRQREWAA